MVTWLLFDRKGLAEAVRASRGMKRDEVVMCYQNMTGRIIHIAVSI